MENLAPYILGFCCGSLTWIITVVLAILFFKGASREVGRRHVMPPRER